MELVSCSTTGNIIVLYNLFLLTNSLCLEHCFIWPRDLDTKKIATEVFGELRNMVLEENGEDKMVRESN